MQEVGSELVFTILQLLLSDTGLLEDGDIKSKLLALQHVRVKEVNNLARVLPRPGTKESGTIDGVSTHVVVEKRVEVQVGHATHLTLQSTHLKLGLVVHLPDELLPILQLHLELLLLLAEEIRALLHTSKDDECLIQQLFSRLTYILEVVLIVLTVNMAWSVGRVNEALPFLIVIQLVIGEAKEANSVRAHFLFFLLIINNFSNKF